ncbi:hypothetical protein IX317_002135 [Fusobacterium sp. DD29]|uniref:hypothetical protein n=1 Tax=unclassified Fusobacterium TaxID=2648384 RepID=UPI001B8AB93F|nr:MULTISPECIES: hypothetical protein [unclassified Fusobacterium]MBR8750413.1 hypothetical protein [Fusobacterium sp. DD29]MBR8762654.1 hypothetical protein [Fusobacterium sp. DD25]MBR8768689.1 hypothetical protein [Fusobacterium sp. DD43]MBR8772762.1 hypothetical protein [Fusobacterium sp. DD40]MBR8776971.1 hypothetical protein [Fusobacterium sp. DD17]
MAYDVKVKRFLCLQEEELQELIWEYLNKGYQIQKTEIKHDIQGLNGIYVFVKQFENNKYYIEQLKKENANYEEIIEKLKQTNQYDYIIRRINYLEERIEHNIKKINLLKEKEKE